MGRIRALPSGVANHVRASQVIGSVERAVEELIQNSILHGAASLVTVTIGTKFNDDFVIVVEDDGMGIDNESMRVLIGTEACCNDAYTVFGNQGRGDSLRSICDLCVEAKIESSDGNVSSTKVIKNGVTVSFEDSGSHAASLSLIIPSVRSIPSNSRTGTRITLRNMFKQFAVRRKNHNSKDKLTSIRATMNMLALSYPLVSFKLINGETGTVDFMLDAPHSSSFAGPRTCRVSVSALEDEATALGNRMEQMNSNEDSMYLRSIKLVGDDGNEFRAFGVLLFEDEAACSGLGRMIQLQVAINGRLAVQSKRLIDVIQTNVKKHFGGNFCGGFIHIASKQSELVIIDSQAMESVPDFHLIKLSKFLASMVASAADSNSARKYSQHPIHVDPKSNHCGYSRIVKGEYLTANSAAITKSSPMVSLFADSSPVNSPFANTFCDKGSSGENRANDIEGNVSFDDAFIDESTSAEDMMDASHSYDDMEDELPSISWTRNRIKAFNSSITELASSCGTEAHKIAFTKEMLASAEVISQVDSSFITIKMGSLICAVDQHAADERVSLEALENALFHHDSHDAMIISLTKRQLQVGDILKSCPVAPSRTVQLTMSQMTTARQFNTLLHRWKFTFEESVEERSIILRGLPLVCGRVAEVSDMREFLNDLGGFAGVSIRPKFVSRVLASNACRYATMFGDALTLQQCEKLIESLSKCRLPFVCAHGRPSIVPLIDMSKESTNEQANVNNIQADASLQKWGPRRVRSQHS